MFCQFYASPVGMLRICSDGEAITGLSFCNQAEAPHPDALTRRAAAQLAEYFAGVRRTFDLPLGISGTPFTQAVLRALLQVPYGQTTTYGLLAAAAGHPGACRAVGTVMRKNRLVLVLPCHRVLAAKGLGGYLCGQEKKRWLLRFEGAVFRG